MSIDSPIFLTPEDSQDWCVDIIAENADRQNLFQGQKPSGRSA
jgi:hypothetical protein